MYSQYFSPNLVTINMTNHIIQIGVEEGNKYIDLPKTSFHNF